MYRVFHVALTDFEALFCMGETNESTPRGICTCFVYIRKMFRILSGEVPRFPSNNVALSAFQFQVDFYTQHTTQHDLTGRLVFAR